MTMEYNKVEIERKLFPIISDQSALRQLGILFKKAPPKLSEVKLFKTLLNDDFSLTEFGFVTLRKTNFFPNLFVGILPKEYITISSNILIINKYFKSPYYIDGHRVFYFDDVLNAEICVFGGLEDFIEAKKLPNPFQ